MKRMVLVVVAILAVLLAVPRAQVRADVALRAATEQETVKGDLKGAIDAYRKIVDGYPNDRTVRAQAMVRLAGCYQKLGDAQAKATYERVVREFGDQPAAAEARLSLARFTGLGSATAGMPSSRMVFRSTPSFEWFAGDVSPDGRLAPYIDRERDRYDLNVHDLVTGRSRTLIAGGRQPDGRWQAATDTVFSRDGSQLAYTWYTTSGTPNPQVARELRMVAMSSGELLKPRTLFAEPTIAEITPRDWSPDGQWIAVDVQRPGGVRQIGLVSTRTGSFSLLKEINARRFSTMRFSPDGQYLLYDLPGVANSDRDIVGMHIKDRTDVSIVAFPGDDSLIGWTPDGKDILFTSARSGAEGIWSVPFSGRVAGDPTLVKPNIAIEETLGLSSTGALWYAPTGQRMTDVKIGTFDARTGRFSQPASAITTDRVGANSTPRLSPDGKSVAFLSSRGDGRLFVIRNLASGQSHEFKLPLRSLRNGNPTLWEWSADGSGFYAIGTTTSDDIGIHKIDATTGQLAWSVGTTGLPGVRLPYDIDGKRIRYWLEKEGSSPDFSLFEWDVATKQRRELYRTSDACRGHKSEAAIYCAVGNFIVRRDWRTAADTPIGPHEPGRSWDISPDGRFMLAQRSRPGATTHRTWWLTDTVSGQTRELLKDRSDAQRTLLWWSPEGTGMVVNIKKETTASPEAWWVPIDGSTPHRLPEIDGIVFDNWAQRGRSVDGRFVFEVAAPNLPSELWVLENFLPAVKKN